MATATPAKLYTVADLLAMPDDGVERWLIRGQLREKQPEAPGVKMTARNRHHSEAMSLIVAELVIWNRSRPQPRGKVYSGEAGVRLHGATATAFGVDVVYAPPEVVAVQNDDETTFLNGVPTLVVEILSPNDTLDQTEEKVDEYLAAGVPLVWTVNPYRRTVMVYRPGEEPQFVTRSQRLPEYPPMPGFAPAVADLFD